MRSSRVLCVLAAVASAGSASYASSLIARWDFDGDYLTTNNNAAYNLTPGGGVSQVASPWGTAAEFHGGVYPITSSPPPSNPGLDRLDTTAAPTNQSFAGGFSIMGWIKPYALDPNNAAVVSHSSSSYDFGNALGFQLSVYQTVELNLTDSSGNKLLAIADGTPIAANQWYHIAASWDGSTSGGVNVYINGDSVPIHFLGSGFQGLNGADPLPIRIGAHLGNADQVVRAFDGAIDHLSFGSGPTSLEEVRSDFNSTVPLPSGAVMGAVCLGIHGLARRSEKRARRTGHKSIPPAN